MINQKQGYGTSFPGPLAKSPAMVRFLNLALRIAKADATILITGETGSGKERVARLIHEQSPRAAGPWVAVNCAAISESLLESELFGHARGAFTGAIRDRPGLFESAQHGTLLLDEMGDVSPAMQVKLLRVIQEREVRRMGENTDRAVDVRIIATTHRDLAEEVALGTFRQDLYYRLNVLALRVPPLRDRREDILPLAQALLGNAALRMRRQLAGFGPGVAARLLQHDWPGNVRELENAMERCAALALGNQVQELDLPEEVRSGRTRLSPVRGSVQPMELTIKEHILAALAMNQGNQTLTARQLQIGPSTLYRKLKSYGIVGQTGEVGLAQGQPTDLPSAS